MISLCKMGALTQHEVRLAASTWESLALSWLTSIAVCEFSSISRALWCAFELSQLFSINCTKTFSCFLPWSAFPSSKVTWFSEHTHTHTHTQSNKDLLQFNTRQEANTNLSMILDRQFIKEDLKIANKYLKRCSASGNA